MKAHFVVCTVGVVCVLTACAAPPINKTGHVSPNASVLIVPHHMVARRQVEDAFARVLAAKKSQNALPKRIILMGPNHFFRGKGQVITTRRVWDTPDGKLSPDQDFISLLLKENLAREEEKVVEYDHAIFEITPFIKKNFPEALLVPLLVREPMQVEDAKKLADFFVKTTQPQDEASKNSDTAASDTLIIASIDFSHYLPQFVADLHDEATIAALHNQDTEFFNCCIDADSPQILELLAEYTKQIGHKKFTLFDHTNSATLTANPYEQVTTSHILGVYERGEQQAVEQLTISLLPPGFDNPLMEKGADFTIFYNPETSGQIFEKNNLRVSVGDYRAMLDPQLLPALLTVKRDGGKISTRLCSFTRENCL